MVCAECMKMCGLGGKNSVVKGLNVLTMYNACLQFLRVLTNLSLETETGPDTVVQIQT